MQVRRLTAFLIRAAQQMKLTKVKGWRGGHLGLSSRVFSQGHRVHSCCPAASWGFWNFIERISSFFLAAPLRNVSPFLYLTVVL